MTNTCRCAQQIKGHSWSENAYKSYRHCAKGPVAHGQPSDAELLPDLPRRKQNVLSAMLLWMLCILPFGIAWPAKSVTARSPAKLLSSTPPNANSTTLLNTTSLPTLGPIQYVQTEWLRNIAYYDDGLTDAPVVILIHGFPRDINAYEEVAPQLVQK